ncbi:MAG: hypothetical protein KBF88_09345 [Polyangiaceae bacterium]|nr:hypothetical protein [Polyangiaceae bacterium]
MRLQRLLFAGTIGFVVACSSGSEVIVEGDEQATATIGTLAAPELARCNIVQEGSDTSLHCFMEVQDPYPLELPLVHLQVVGKTSGQLVEGMLNEYPNQDIPISSGIAANEFPLKLNIAVTFPPSYADSVVGFDPAKVELRKTYVFDAPNASSAEPQSFKQPFDLWETYIQYKSSDYSFTLEPYTIATDVENAALSSGDNKKIYLSDGKVVAPDGTNAHVFFAVGAGKTAKIPGNYVADTKGRANIKGADVYIGEAKVFRRATEAEATSILESMGEEPANGGGEGGGTVEPPPPPSGGGGVTTGPTKCGKKDQKCCADSMCEEGSCVANMCRVACGNDGQSCCTTGTCAAGNVCKTGNLAARTCWACGGPGQPCCAETTQTSACGEGALCQTVKNSVGTSERMCVSCGNVGEGCCGTLGKETCGADAFCGRETTSSTKKSCLACGGVDQPCCPGVSSTGLPTAPSVCGEGGSCQYVSGVTTKMCVACGGIDQACCTDKPEKCASGGVCSFKSGKSVCVAR